MTSPDSLVHDFWRRTLAELSRVPMDAQLDRAPEMSGRDYTTSRVALTSWQGVRIRAWYSVPNDAPRRGLRAVMAVPGYSGTKPIPVHLAQLGYAVLTLYPRAQGESGAEWQLPEATKLTWNLTDRERYYYRGGYADCVRGLDFLASRPEVDAGRLGMWGRSQGGGLTLATAAIDSRLGAAVAEEPFLCNFPEAIASVRTAPYVELSDHLDAHPEQKAAALDTLTCFDPLTLAHRISCPVLVSAGMKDEVCPYRTIAPVFERIPCQKALIAYPDLAHAASTDFNVHATGWLAHYLG